MSDALWCLMPPLSPTTGLEEALRDTKAKDNILPKLMASPAAAFDALFVTELKKYEGLKAGVARNVGTNDELLAGGCGREPFGAGSAWGGNAKGGVCMGRGSRRAWRAMWAPMTGCWQVGLLAVGGPHLGWGLHAVGGKHLGGVCMGGFRS